MLNVYLYFLYFKSSPVKAKVDHCYGRSKHNKLTKEEADKIVDKAIADKKVMNKDGKEKRVYQSEICPIGWKLIGPNHQQRNAMVR